MPPIERLSGPADDGSMMRVRGFSLIGLLVAASALLVAIVVAAHAFRAGRKWNGAGGSPTRDLRL